jgi:hypothetical protein
MGDIAMPRLVNSKSLGGDERSFHVVSKKDFKNDEGD